MGIMHSAKRYNVLDFTQAKGLIDSINAYQSGVKDAAYNSQQTLQNLLETYKPEEFAQNIRENSINKANEAQQQLMSQAVRKAGSAFNTAAQSAAQRSTASAVGDINAKAEQQIADYNRITLNNILDQYGNYTASYQNLLEQLIGQTDMQHQSKAGDALSLANGVMDIANKGASLAGKFLSGGLL